MLSKKHSISASIKTMFLSAFLAWSLVTLGSAGAQDATKQRVLDVSERITELVSQMEKRAAAYPDVLKQLRDGKDTIENADQIVDGLIKQLTSLTDNMEDGKELQQAIVDYQALTSDLIAEADSSNDDAIKSAIPDLEKTLQTLKDSDTLRAAKVIEARNAIRDLEDNRTRISFFIRAGQVVKAADAIAASVDDFADIVDGAKELAADLISEASSP